MSTRFHGLAMPSDYLDAMLERYATNPDGLPSEWRAAFDLVDAYFPSAFAANAATPEALEALLRRYAHLVADLDPLGRTPPPRWDRLRAAIEQRLPAGHASDARSSALLGAYAGHLAVETGHIDAIEQVEWIHAQRESAREPEAVARARALAALARGEAFERFMSHRFVGKKRFGAEGAESIHPLVQRILDRAGAAGIREVVVGTMHRGRLGLMAAIFGQPPDQLFCRMRGQYPFERAGLPADVPYHLGLEAEYQSPAGPVRIHVLPNPSHLEAINAVALGYARRRQEALGGTDKVLPLILHTDASVAAQGVVSEALQLSGLAGHHVGGALNIVINNQVGFTTDPEAGRTSRHCTAQWKCIDSLIAHVNGDDVDAVLTAADLAFDYRQAYAGESVIDLVCLRANGHNEVDEPRFTQPQYYDLAATRTSLSSRYATQPGMPAGVDAARAEAVASAYRSELDAAYDVKVAATTPEADASTPAFLPAAPLEEVAVLASRVPADGQFNAKAMRLVGQRLEEWHEGVSWPTAEVLALGTVLSMGQDVRLTGQDVERGAFSQRHYALVDGATGRARPVYEGAPAHWGRLSVHNTALCEYATLSFEYGYAVAAGGGLTIWESQFGDFANVAQVALDQFVASGADKWRQHCGLVVLLPHGLEGQGPEHSSGRMERMVQLAANGNMRIAHPSTPANYYHLLVSQLNERARRPLVVFTPKKLLRLKAALSAPAEFGAGTAFQPLHVDAAAGKPTRVVLCSGKIYYDLKAALAESGRDDITIVRLEQLYPFPEAELAAVLAHAPRCEIVWLQEEPANYGLWTWLRGRVEAAAASARSGCGPLRCVARPETSSPAGSFHTEHEAVQAQLIARALAPSAATATATAKRR